MYTSIPTLLALNTLLLAVTAAPAPEVARRVAVTAPPNNVSRHLPNPTSPFTQLTSLFPPTDRPLLLHRRQRLRPIPLPRPLPYLLRILHHRLRRRVRHRRHLRRQQRQRQSGQLPRRMRLRARRQCSVGVVSGDAARMHGQRLRVEIRR